MSRREYALQIRERNPRLFKVPAMQRRVIKEAYDPCLFSFGPYHAGAASLSDGEHIKVLVAADLIGPLGLEMLVAKIQEHGEQLRKLYIQMRFEGQPAAAAANCWQLAKLLAFDSILIVSAALSRNLGLFGAFLYHQIIIDAIRLENQVPVFVLEYALESLMKGGALQGVGAGELKMTTVLNDLISYFHLFDGSPFAPISEAAVNGEMSLLGHAYNRLTRRGERPVAAKQEAVRSWSCEQQLLSSASHLARCGLRFKPCLNSGFESISFDEQKLELHLPKITVSDATIPFLHNLLAYETTAIDAHLLVVSYVHFMDCLIDDEKDVQLLVDAGVICNLLGSHHELASSWNRLCSYVALDPTAEHVHTATRVRTLTQKRWRMWKASLTEKYWENQPWLLVSLIAATILLLLSLLQTIYAIKK